MTHLTIKLGFKLCLVFPVYCTGCPNKLCLVCPVYCTGCPNKLYLVCPVYCTGCPNKLCLVCPVYCTGCPNKQCLVCPMYCTGCPNNQEIQIRYRRFLIPIILKISKINVWVLFPARGFLGPWIPLPPPPPPPGEGPRAQRIPKGGKFK